MPKVGFVHRGGPAVASYRYRCDIPCNALKSLGVDASINSGDIDILVVSKPEAADIQMVKSAKDQGCKVIVDYCDDHFNHEALGPIYRTLAARADELVCPTEVMRNLIMDYVGKDSAVIDDPYEMPHREPHAGGQKLIWFGHPLNVKDLQPYFYTIQGYDLKIVTGHNLLVPYTLYSRDVLKRELTEANIAFFPKSADYKSPNRLVNAIRMGCFAVCGRHPAYQQFKQFMWVGHLPSGLSYARAFQNELNDRVKEAQSYIERFSPSNIGLKWQSLIASI